jgi:hypothetical protein
MRFLNPQDYATFVKINKELVNTVIDVEVILYKIHQELTKTNLYGEATKKVWYSGVLIPAMVDLQSTDVTDDAQSTNTEQKLEVSFLRQECADRNVYPEMGDIIQFRESYFEINNTNEIQLIAGRPEYNHSIVCSTHLTRKTNLQLEPPQI